MKPLIVLISMVMCPWATLKGIFHSLTTFHRKEWVYCYNFRFLIFCSLCDKVFVNELTQREVDELEGPRIKFQDKDND